MLLKFKLNLLVRTTVMSTSLGWRAHNNLHTRVRCIVLTCTLLTIHVSETIGIFLDEFIVSHDLNEEEEKKRLRKRKEKKRQRIEKKRKRKEKEQKRKEKEKKRKEKKRKEKKNDLSEVTLPKLVGSLEVEACPFEE